MNEKYKALSNDLLKVIESVKDFSELAEVLNNDMRYWKLHTLLYEHNTITGIRIDYIYNDTHLVFDTSNSFYAIDFKVNRLASGHFSNDTFNKKSLELAHWYAANKKTLRK